MTGKVHPRLEMGVQGGRAYGLQGPLAHVPPSTHTGSPGTVWHIRGGQVPAQQLEGMMSLGAGLSFPTVAGMSPPHPCQALGFLADPGSVLRGVWP